MIRTTESHCLAAGSYDRGYLFNAGQYQGQSTRPETLSQPPSNSGHRVSHAGHILNPSHQDRDSFGCWSILGRVERSNGLGVKGMRSYAIYRIGGKSYHLSRTQEALGMVNSLRLASGQYLCVH
jgi:hypothetical protein